MKYCPYCGAALPDSTVSFCPECGKSLPESSSSAPAKPSKEKKPHEKPKKSKPVPKKRARTEFPAEDDYDGYYDDRIPIDEGHRRDGLDKGMIKKVAALVLGLLIVIGACVAILYTFIKSKYEKPLSYVEFSCLRIVFPHMFPLVIIQKVFQGDPF